MPSNNCRIPSGKAAAYRARLRAKGLRPIHIWAPDTRTPAFSAEAHRQSAAVAARRLASDDQSFVDAIADPWPA